MKKQVAPTEHKEMYSSITEDVLFDEPGISKLNSKESNFIKDDFSALKLFEFDYEDLPKLLDPIFQK